MIPGIPEEAGRQAVAVLTADPRVQKITLFGSRAKGTFRPGSDIDLCLEAPELDFSSMTRLEDQLDDLMLPWRFDLARKDQIDNLDLLAHIDRCGVILWPPLS